MADAASPSVPPAPSACTRGERSALAEIACEVGRQLGSPPDTTIAFAEPASDRPVTRGAELGARLGHLVAGSLGAGARVLPKPLTLAAARAAAKGSKNLLFVALEVRGGRALCTADLYPVTTGFWDRVRLPFPGPLSHAFASRAIDGEIGSFFPTIPLVTGSIDAAALGAPDTVALACGDVDGDGSLELVIVGRRKILVGRVHARRFVPVAETSLSALSPVASAPLREPIGSASVLAEGGVRLGLTDRESAVELGKDLALATRLHAVLPWDSVGCVGQNGLTLTPAVPCTAGEKATLDTGGASDIDAIASGRAVRGDGEASTVIAFRSAHDASVTLKDSRGRTVRVPDAGAALAVGDVDRDGAPELLTSVNTQNPAEDALVVRTWERGGSVRDRYRLAVKEGIRALSVCPPESGELSPIVVATDRDVRVVR